MRFLIVDDHPVVRQTLKMMLLAAFSGCTVEEAGSAQQAMELLPRGRYDVVLLDLGLPDRSGLDLLRDVKNLAPDAPVLVFSGQCEEEFGERALKAGASGFVPKTCAAGEIQTAVRRLLAGKKYVTPDLAVALANQATRQQSDRPPHDSLSERELEVLRMLGDGCTLSSIADRLGISIKTVSTYRARILDKLEVKTTAGLVRYAVLRKLVE